VTCAPHRGRHRLSVSSLIFSSPLFSFLLFSQDEFRDALAGLRHRKTKPAAAAAMTRRLVELNGLQLPHVATKILSSLSRRGEVGREPVGSFLFRSKPHRLDGRLECSGSSSHFPAKLVDQILSCVCVPRR